VVERQGDGEARKVGHSSIVATRERDLP